MVKVEISLNALGNCLPRLMKLNIAYPMTPNHATTYIYHRDKYTCLPRIYTSCECIFRTALFGMVPTRK